MRIPIEYTSRPNAAPGDYGSPTIPFSIGWGDRRIPGRALVDTGSDLLMVDAKLLAATGCAVSDRVCAVRTVHGVLRHPYFIADLRFDDAKVQSIIDVIGMDLSGRAYTAIFGTRLLELGRMVLDVSGESYFEFDLANVASVRG